MAEKRTRVTVGDKRIWGVACPHCHTAYDFCESRFLANGGRCCTECGMSVNHDEQEEDVVPNVVEEALASPAPGYPDGVGTSGSSTAMHGDYARISGVVYPDYRSFAQAIVDYNRGEISTEDLLVVAGFTRDQAVELAKPKPYKRPPLPGPQVEYSVWQFLTVDNEWMAGPEFRTAEEAIAHATSNNDAERTAQGHRPPRSVWVAIKISTTFEEVS